MVINTGRELKQVILEGEELNRFHKIKEKLGIKNDSEVLRFIINHYRAESI